MILVACEYSQKIIEAWIVPGYPAYAVTACGRIYSQNKKGKCSGVFRELKPSTDKKGYLGLTLCTGNKHKKIRVHKIVALTFLENPDNLPCVRHKDGNKLNNHKDNLAWGSYLENEQDKKNHGTYEARRNGKLNLHQRNEIREKLLNGESQKSLAAAYNVTRPTITRLANGKTWENDR